MKVKWILNIFLLLIRRPTLWPIAIKQIFRIAKNGWFHTFPFLPLPSKDFFDFRILTYQGNESDLPDAEVVIAWLSWATDLKKMKT